MKSVDIKNIKVPKHNRTAKECHGFGSMIGKLLSKGASAIANNPKMVSGALGALKGGINGANAAGRTGQISLKKGGSTRKRK